MKPFAHIFAGLLMGLTSSFVAADSSGTGFFISSDGLIATNFHVIEGGQSITITRFNGRQSIATPLITDKANDIAVLQVHEGSTEAFLPVRHSSTVQLGADLLTIGFPLTSIQGIEPKVTSGILSSLSGMRDDPTRFQISVPVQPGNSGGPLIAKDGSVVGIVTSKLNAMGVVKATGDIPQNVNFAVKSSYLVELFGTRLIDSRVKANFKAGPTLSTEDIVRRALNAVVLINVKTGQITPPVKAPETRPPQDPGPSTAVFGNVRFATLGGQLEVVNITPNNSNSRTTLRIGDRVVGCMSKVVVYEIGDLVKCAQTGKSPVEGKVQYIFRIHRAGEESVSSIIK